MDRPSKFEHNRWVGDRRTQVVYDIDNVDEDVVADLLSTDWDAKLRGPAYTCFGPDTLVEARNRGYKPYAGNGSGKPDVDTSAA